MHRARWGEPVKDFVKVLEKHAKVRYPKGQRNERDCDQNEPSDDVTYWVCAYANNQHDLDSDIPVTEPAFLEDSDGSDNRI